MPKIMRPTKPELDYECWIYIQAFYDLSTCRSVGSEIVGDIPYTAILTWLKKWNIAKSEQEFYLEIIPQLDRVYLKYIHEKREEAIERASRGGSKGFGKKPTKTR